MSFPCIAGNSSAKECYEHHLSTMSEQPGTMQADSKGFHLNHSQSISTLTSFIAFFHLKLKKKNPKQQKQTSEKFSEVLFWYRMWGFFTSPQHIFVLLKVLNSFFFFFFLMYSEPYTNKLLDWSIPQPGN